MEWQHVMDELHAQLYVNKKTNILDGKIITSDKAFFEKTLRFFQNALEHIRRKPSGGAGVCVSAPLYLPA